MADLKGLKRICMSCGARFYDLNKKPIICPNCSVEFTGEIKVKARRGRLAPEDDAIPEEIEDEVAEVVVEEDDDIEADEETVSLEDIEEGADDVEEEDVLEIDDDIDDLDDDLDDDVEEDIAEDDEK